MNKIIHFKIPLDNDGRPMIDYKTVQYLMEKARKVFPKYYKPIASPFDVTIDKKIVTIDSTNINDFITNNSKEQIIDILKETIEENGMEVKIIK